MKFSSLLIFLFFYTALGAQEKRVYYADKNLAPRERFVDFTHLKLDISFQPVQKQVKGKVIHEFEVLRKELDTLFLDGVKMKYSEVLLDGKKVEYTSNDEGITLSFSQPLRWGEKHRVSISYEAFPMKGIYFIGWNDKTGRSRKQIWTQGQGIDNRHWIPMYDERNEKIISEVSVTFDGDYEVLSNGELIEKEKVPLQMDTNLVKWHYKISYPHAPYLIMLGIGEYGIVKEKSASGIPLNLYYYHDQPEQANPTYIHSVRMFDFFEKEIGVPYPWETYSQIPVQDFMYGAMENTTATIFGDFYLVDEREFLDRNYVRVDAHELAHQWFGDMVTARSAAHHWLQESFATHYDLLYQRIAFGDDHYNWVRRNYNDQALAASEKDLKPVGHSEGGTVRHYPKGAHVLQMLKYVVGREQFNAAIKYYLEKHAYQNVDSDDLLIAFHEKLGLSLDWFWEEWIYKGGEPHYLVDFDTKRKKGTFRVEQIQPEEELSGNFKMPVVFEIHYKDGSQDAKRVWIENDTTEVVFELGKKKVDFILFDPNSEIMKAVDFEKSTDMLKAQASGAKHMIDRYDAYVALDTLDFKGKEKFLIDRYYAERFHANKAILLKRIMTYESEEAQAVLKDALESPMVELRKAALYNTTKWNPELKNEYEALLNDSSYVVIADALEILSLTNTEEVVSYLEKTKGIEGNRSHNVVITWLKIAYFISKEEDLLNRLADYTSDSYEFLTRSNAANALKEMNKINMKGVENLIEASFHFNSRLRNVARGVLDHFNEQEEYRKMIRDYIKSGDWTDREKRILERFEKP